MAGTTMIKTALPTAAWTKIVTATPTSVTMQNVGGVDLSIWIGGGSAPALFDGSVAADFLRPGEHRTYTLNAADNAYATPFNQSGGPGLINVRY